MATQAPTEAVEQTLEDQERAGNSPQNNHDTTEYKRPSLEDDVDFSRDTRKKESSAELEDEEQLEEDDSGFGIYSEETAESTGLKALLYGPTGGGKTWLAATFPKPVFLDLEKGMKSLLQLGPVMRFPSDPNREVRDLDEVRDFFRLCKAQTQKENPKIESVVIDSLNEMYHLVVAEVVGDFKVSRQYDDQLTMADYGKVNRLFLGIVRNFLKLPLHIVMTAVEMPREYEGQETYPKFPGKQIWPELQRMVDQIGYVHVRKGEGTRPDHVVSFWLSPSFVAKDRLSITEQYVPNNYDAILAAIPKGRVKVR